MVRALLTVLLAVSTFTHVIAQESPDYRRVSGRVVDPDRQTGAITGRVTRPDGTPSMGATVTAVGEGSARSNRETPVKTDASGHFRIDRLPAGSYVVSVRQSARTELEAAGRRVPRDSREYVETFYPGTADSRAATRVEVHGGRDTANIDIRLEFEQGFTILGRILDEAGRALSPVWLEWAPISGEGFGHEDVESRDGSFAISNVIGDIGVLAHAQTDQGPLIGTTTVHVTSAPIRGVVIRLAPPARVRGRVVIEASATRPGDQGPLLGVALRTRWPRIQCFSDVVHETSGENFRGHAGKDGRFEIAGAVGERIIEVEGLPAGWRIKEVRRRGRLLPDRRLMLHPRDLITGIEIIVTDNP